MKNENQPTDRFPRINKDAMNNNESISPEESSPQTMQDNIQQWLNEGIKELNERHSAKAIKLFQRVLELDPENIVAYEKMTIARSVQADLESLEEFLLLGREYIERKEWNLAAEELRAVLAIQPDHHEARKLLNQIKDHLVDSQDFFMDQTITNETATTETSGSTDYESFEDSFVDRDYSDSNSQDVESFLAQDQSCEKEIEHAISCYEEGNFLKAKELLKNLDRDYPNHTQIVYYLQIIERQLLNEKSSQDQENAECALKEGMDEMSKGNLTSAIKHFEMAVKLKPDFSQAKLMLDKAKALIDSKSKSIPKSTLQSTGTFRQSLRNTPKRTFPVLKILGIMGVILVIGGIGYFLGVKYPEVKMRKTMKAASNLIADKEYQQALALVTEVVEANEDNFEAWEILGSINLTLNKSGDAIFAYKKAIKLDPERTDLIIKLGNAYFKDKNYSAALYQYQEAGKNPSYSVQANFRSALCYQHLNNLTEAKNSLNKAIKLNPDYAKAYLDLAKILSREGDNDGAEAAYLAAIDKDSKLIESFLELGRFYIKNNQLDRAIDILNQPLIWLAPSNDKQAKYVCELRFLLGEAYFNKKAYVQAQEQYNKIILIREDPRAFMEVGRVYYKLNKDQAAITAWFNAAKLDPGNADVYFNLGTIYYLHIKDFKSAIDQFLMAIEKDPNHARAYANLGFVYQQMSKFPQAVDAWEKSIQIDPNQPIIKARLKEYARN